MSREDFYGKKWREKTNPFKGKKSNYRESKSKPDLSDLKDLIEKRAKRFNEDSTVDSLNQGMIQALEGFQRDPEVIAISDFIFNLQQEAYEQSNDARIAEFVTLAHLKNEAERLSRQLTSEQTVLANKVITNPNLLKSRKFRSELGHAHIGMNLLLAFILLASLVIGAITGCGPDDGVDPLNPTTTTAEVTPTPSAGADALPAPSPEPTTGSGNGTPPEGEVIVVQPESSPRATTRELSAINAISELSGTSFKLENIHSVGNGVFIAFDNVNNAAYIAISSQTDLNAPVNVNKVSADGFSWNKGDTKVTFTFNGKDSSFNIKDAEDSGVPTITAEAAPEPVEPTPEAEVRILGEQAFIEFGADNPTYYAAINQVKNNMIIYAPKQDGGYGTVIVDFDNTEFKVTEEGLVAITANVEMLFDVELNNWKIEQLKTSSGFVTYNMTTGVMNNRSNASESSAPEEEKILATNATTIQITNATVLRAYESDRFSFYPVSDKTYEEQIRETGNAIGVQFSENFNVYTIDEVDTQEFTAKMEEILENRFLIAFTMLHFNIPNPTLDQFNQIRTAYENGTPMSVVTQNGVWELQKGVVVNLIGYDNYSIANTYSTKDGQLVLNDFDTMPSFLLISNLNFANLASFVRAHVTTLPETDAFLPYAEQTAIFVEFTGGAEFIGPIVQVPPSLVKE